jgi:hypothetical protein
MEESLNVNTNKKLYDNKVLQDTEVKSVLVYFLSDLVLVTEEGSMP